MLVVIVLTLVDNNLVLSDYSNVTSIVISKGFLCFSDGSEGYKVKLDNLSYVYFKEVFQ